MDISYVYSLVSYPDSSPIVASVFENSIRDKLLHLRICEPDPKLVLKIIEKCTEILRQSSNGSSLKSLHQVLVLTTKIESPRVLRALTKTRGYLKRLFSEESWEEWTQQKTALGRIVQAYEFLGLSEDVWVKRLSSEVILKAEEQARRLLGQLSMEELDASEVFGGKCPEDESKPIAFTGNFALEKGESSMEEAFRGALTIERYEDGSAKEDMYVKVTESAKPRYDAAFSGRLTWEGDYIKAVISNRGEKRVVFKITVQREPF